MSESNSSNAKNLILPLLDALQRHTLFLLTSAFAVIITSYNKYSLKAGGIDIPQNVAFYAASGLIIYSYWNLWRLSSKLNQLISVINEADEADRYTLFFHHWILSPFNNIFETRIRFTDCIPIAFIFFLAAAIGKYIVRYFNSTTALKLWNSVLPHFLITVIVWSIGILIVILSALFINNIASIIESLKNSKKWFYVYTIGIALGLVGIEELIKRLI
jgi:hypothetical protein